MIKKIILIIGLILFTNILGYTDWICPVCNNKYSEKYLFCPLDNTTKPKKNKENIKVYYCPNCGYKISNRYQFCPKCGLKNRFYDNRFTINKDYRLFNNFLFGMKTLFSTSEELQKARNILLKSTIFPGWGQLQLKQYDKSIIFSLSSLAGIVSSIVFYNKANDAYDNYKIVTKASELEHWQSKTRDFNRKKKIAIYTTIAVWLYNIIDLSSDVKGIYNTKIRLKKNNPEFNFEIKF